jgi:hypothetical protein
LAALSALNAFNLLGQQLWLLYNQLYRLLARGADTHPMMEGMRILKAEADLPRCESPYRMPGTEAGDLRFVQHE